MAILLESTKEYLIVMKDGSQHKIKLYKQTAKDFAVALKTKDQVATFYDSDEQVELAVITGEVSYFKRLS